VTDGPPAIGAVVLAAGGSSRLGGGAPKQLLAYGGRPLVRRAAEAALAAATAPVVVVLGARADAVREALAGLPVRVVVNAAWAEGMSTSVAAGVRALLDATADGAGLGSALDGALLTLADQPLVDAAALGALVRAFAERRTPIVAAEYGAVVGAPALFARARLDALLALPPGDRGAGALLRGAAAHELTRVPLAAAALDVDTPADAAALAAAAPAEVPNVEAGA
jgi:molybdenum cofactor cytidylyltransferase